jgi:inner membrane protein
VGEVQRSRLVCLAPAVLLGVIWLMDSLPVKGSGVVVIGAVDEPAHLATAVLCLLAVGGPRLPLRHRQFFIIAAAMAVLIDLDHLVLYADVPHVSLPGGRPYSHSLVTPLVLLGLAVVWGRARPVLVAAALGVMLHFVRDIATGPGLPIWWPLQDREHLLPYGLYFGAIGCLAGVAVLRLYFQADTPMAEAKGLVREAA